MLQQDQWFTEIHSEAGTAFSLKITERLHHEKTPYQTIDIYATERFGRLMVIDGFIMLSDRDNFLYHEMMSHPALFTHPDPRRVVIIGGGDCGTLREVLKHPRVEAAVQVEIDERVTRLAEEFFSELCESNGDERAELRFEDGIRWMAEAPAGSVDVVIVDSTDPIGPAEGLFNEAFYCQCHRALGERGILVQQSESPVYHLALLEAMHRAMRAAGFAATRVLGFPQPVYPSGWWSATLATKGGTADSFRAEDARARPFVTRYYDEAVHAAALVTPPFVRAALGLD